MIIFEWTVVALALFSAQYSYRVDHTKLSERHISVVNGTLKTCIYEDDRSFKKGSPTLPRSELRLLEEFSDEGIKNATVKILSHPEVSKQFSLWQLFGNGPVVMVRNRLGQKQLVVWGGSPHIQPIEKFVEFCQVRCGPEGWVNCEGYTSFGEIDCGDSLHLKVGVYAQGSKPKDTMCSTYGQIELSSEEGPRVLE